MISEQLAHLNVIILSGDNPGLTSDFFTADVFLANWSFWRLQMIFKIPSQLRLIFLFESPGCQIDLL